MGNPLRFLTCRGFQLQFASVLPAQGLQCTRHRRPTNCLALLKRPGLCNAGNERAFVSAASLREQKQQSAEEHELTPKPAQRRKQGRSAGKTSLRRAAVEAQRSKDGVRPQPVAAAQSHTQSKVVRAYCVAEQLTLPKVITLLESKGYSTDPHGTAMYPHVVHTEIAAPQHTSSGEDPATTDKKGDIFIFPSGTIVAWSLPEAAVSHLISNVILPAAENPHMDQVETEDFDYSEDPTKESSSIKGDTIILGTKAESTSGADHAATTEISETAGRNTSRTKDAPQIGAVNTVLVKIAFSSGLARSTKLAVLETLLDNYFDSTRSIPTMLSRGSRLPYTRSFILRKTGQLLSMRAQLNLYSELTDSLPDLFWDSKHELGLEGIYDQVGRALDIGVRIHALNKKMDYAQEIASVLRERLSEKHGLTLEWMIIALITIEVAFEILRLVKERHD